MNARLALPKNLSAMGVTPAHIGGLVEPALADHCAATNPRKISAADMEGLFRAALN
jgi:hypothetical protein